MTRRRSGCQTHGRPLGVTRASGRGSPGSHLKPLRAALRREALPARRPHIRHTEAVSHRRRARPRPLDSAAPLVLVQTWLLLLLLIVGALIVLVDARHDAEAKDRALVLGVARTVANSPFVFSSVLTADPPTRLAAYAKAVAAGERARLRGHHVARPHPMDPSRPDPRRQAVRRPDPAGAGRRDVHRVLSQLDGPVGASRVTRRRRRRQGGRAGRGQREQPGARQRGSAPAGPCWCCWQSSRWRSPLPGPRSPAGSSVSARRDRPPRGPASLRPEPPSTPPRHDGSASGPARPSRPPRPAPPAPRPAGSAARPAAPAQR